MYEETTPAEPVYERYGPEEAAEQLVFCHCELKAAVLTHANELVPPVPTFFLKFAMCRADGEGDHVGPFEVLIPPSDLGDMIGMFAAALGQTMQTHCEHQAAVANDFVKELEG